MYQEFEQVKFAMKVCSVSKWNEELELLEISEIEYIFNPNLA